MDESRPRSVVIAETLHADITVLRPGDKLRARSDGAIVELDRRKEPGDLPGWWLTDGSGIADHALWAGWVLTDVGRPEAPSRDYCAAKAAEAIKSGRCDEAAAWTDLARALS